MLDPGSLHILPAGNKEDEKPLESLNSLPGETDPIHSHPSSTPFSDLLSENSRDLSELEMSLPRVLPSANELELGQMTQNHCQSFGQPPVDTDPVHSHPSGLGFFDLPGADSRDLSELEMSLPRVLPTVNNELELGHMTEHASNQSEAIHSHVTENAANTRAENTINLERLEQTRGIDKFVFVLTDDIWFSVYNVTNEC